MGGTFLPRKRLVAAIFALLVTIIGLSNIGLFWLITANSSSLWWWTAAATPLISLAITLALWPVLGRDLHILKDRAERAAVGDFGLDRVIVNRRDELGIITDGFNEMLVQIQSRGSRSARYREDIQRQNELRIDELSTLNRQLSVARDAAEKALAVRSQLLANISHELRTPMNGILGMATLLDRTELSAKQQHFVATIVGSSDQMLGLVNDMLDLAQLDRGEIVLHDLEFSLHTLLDEVATRAAGLARSAQKKIDIKTTTGHTSPTTVVGDAGRIRQVLDALTSNAVKFTSHGEVEAGMLATPAGDEAAVINFFVRDTGVGIPQDRLDDLFAAFRQRDESDTREAGGTGMGLALARELVTLLGDELAVESEVGQGSTFSFSVTLGCADAQWRDNLRNDHATADLMLQKGTDEPVVATGNTGSASKPREGTDTSERDLPEILLVEDNPVNREIASAMLEQLGYSVITAENGKVALERFERGRYAAVIMDCQMPEMDGYAATEAIRRIEHAEGSSHTPIIALTAHVSDENRQRALASGMDAFLGKPVMPTALRQSIGECIRSSGA